MNGGIHSQPPPPDDNPNPQFSTPSPDASRDRRLSCPHCGDRVQLAEVHGHEVTCPNCGSCFRVDFNSTASYHRGRTPTAIGRFQILKLLGRGTFGEVYQARDHKLDRTVAVKIPRAESFATHEDEQRFLREARSAAGLRHAGIVQVHEVARDGVLPYIVSDYIQGMTLADLLSGGRLGFREAAKLIAELADALDYAHRHGVVHRDIKPSNILLATEPQNGGNQSHLVPLISDFGLARRDEGEVTVTFDGQVLGTPAYMSPEQATGNHELVDGKSDVYSLGVVLYELLTGELPFRGNQRMLLHQVLYDDPRPPRTLNDRLPRDLETICLTAMAKVPARRYATAADFASDLRRYLRGDPIRARPVGRLERTWRWCQRKPTAAGMIALLVVLAVGGIWTAIREKVVADEQRESAKKEGDLRADVERALAESNSRLVQNYVANGVRLMGEEDVSASLVWNVQALEAVQGNPDREYSHRLRLQSAMRACPRPVQIWTHDTGVTIADFVPGGRLVMATAGSELFLWDLDTGEAAAPAVKHPAFVIDAACSPDGQYVLTLCQDGTVRLWAVATGKQHGPDLLIEGNALCAAFSQDGKLVAAGGNGLARVWRVEDAAAGGPAIEDPEGRTLITQVAFSPTADRLLTAASRNEVSLTAEFDIWDIATGRLLSRAPQERPRVAFVKAATWNHAGDKVASCFHLAPIRVGAWIWDAATGRELVRLAPGDEVSAVRFSPDDRLVATAVATVFHAASINDAYVWSATDGTRKAGPLRHYGRINSLEFSPDGGYIATASDDRTVRVWETTSGKPATPPLHHGLAANGARFGHDGRLLLTFSGDKTVRIWDLAAHNPLVPPVVAADWSDDSARSDDGKLLALETGQRDVAVFDLDSGDQISYMRTPHGTGIDKLQYDADRWQLLTAINKIQFGPDRRRLLTAGNDKTAQLWDAYTGKSTAPPFRHGLPVRDARFSHDGKLVATRTASDDSQQIQLWDVETGREKFAPFTAPYDVQDLEFSRDDRLFAAVSCERGKEYVIFVWEVASGKLVRRLHREATLMEIEFSPDNRRLAGASGWDFSGINDEALILDAESGKVIASLPHTGGVQSIHFSADGSHLVTASADGNVTIWDSESWQRSAPVIAMPGARDVWAEFTADGRGVITSNLRLWDATTGIPMTLPADRALQVLVLAPGGSATSRPATFKLPSVWNAAIESRSVADWQRLSAVVSGRQLDEKGSLVPLEGAELSKRWKALNDSQPDTASWSASEIRQWHERAAVSLFAMDDWWGADWHFRHLAPEQLERRPALVLAMGMAQLQLGHGEVIIERLTKLLEARPNERPLLLQRAQALAAEKKWSEAAADFTSLARTAGDTPQEQADLYYRAALCCLAADDQTGYRKLCKELSERLGQSDDRIIAARIAYTLLPAPNAVDDYGQVLRLSRLVAMGFDYGARLVGASLYRAGQIDEVEGHFETARKPFPRRAWDYYFLALTYQRLGKHEQAHDHLEKGNEWWRTNFDKVSWTEQVEMRGLRKEAEDLISGGRP
jgi:WD40 repeat protein/tRNA A-37 threonylcarbamoyl transferase component Bud32/tetratricopeptide (TPR) repeat protein